MPTPSELITAADAKLGAMDASLGVATERQGVLLVKLAGNPLMKTAKEAQAAISAAHDLLREASEALAAAGKAVAPVPPAPPAPAPAMFTTGTRAEFDAWLATPPQNMVLLDGIKFNPGGFGPPAEFWTLPGGMVSNVKPAPAPSPEPTPGPEEPELRDYPMPTVILEVPGALVWGNNTRGYPLQTDYINALPFVAEKSGLVNITHSEFLDPQLCCQCALSEIRGDLTNRSEGISTTSELMVQAGKTYWYNCRAWSSDIGPSAKYAVQRRALDVSWPV